MLEYTFLLVKIINFPTKKGRKIPLRSFQDFTAEVLFFHLP